MPHEPLLVLTGEELGFGPETKGTPCLSPQFLHLQMIQGMDTWLGFGRHYMGTLSMLALLRGHSYRRCVVQGRSQLVPGWEEEENGGASCKVSFILPLLWSFFFPVSVKKES